MTLPRFTRLPFAASNSFAPRMLDGSQLDADWSPIARYRADVEHLTLVSGRVSQWNDMSGNGRHLIQATADSRPIVTSNAINGQPAVTFGDNGLARFLSAANVVPVGDTSVFSMAIIFRLEPESSPTNATYQALIGNTTIAATNQIAWANKDGFFEAGVGGPERARRGGLSVGDWHLGLYSWDDETETVTVQADRSPLATDGGAGQVENTGIFVGASSAGPAAPLFGDIREIIIFPEQIFAVDQAALLQSIKDYVRANVVLDV